LRQLPVTDLQCFVVAVGAGTAYIPAFFIALRENLSKISLALADSVQALLCIGNFLLPKSTADLSIKQARRRRQSVRPIYFFG